MKRLILFNALLMCNVFFIYLFGVEIGLGQDPPRPRIGEESTSMMSSSTLKKLTSKTTSTVYYPVSADVNEVALTVIFSQPVGYATVMVYDANNQLVDMVTVDTAIDTEATISTETWAAGSYRLVINYGTTTLSGNFNF
jgi:hypothetical protein